MTTTAMTTSTSAPAATTTTTGRIGDSPLRPDGTLKVTGEFAYASDLWHDDMVWGVTLRSPHPHARIRSIDITEALTDRRGHRRAHRRRRARRERRRARARRPAGARRRRRPLPGRAGRPGRRRPPRDRAPRGGADRRRLRGAARASPIRDGPWTTTPRRCNEHGNLVRHLRLRRGEAEPTAPVVVSLDFEVGMQDQAFLGPESGLAVPAEDGGVDLYVATQWLHVDQRQMCRALGLPPEKVRLHPRRRRRRVRRPRGPVGARARLPARAAHRAGR